MTSGLLSVGCARFGYELIEASVGDSGGATSLGGTGGSPSWCAMDGCAPPANPTGTGGRVELDSGADATAPNPPESDSGLATCSDGVLNQGEVTVDCAGPCPICIPTSCTSVIADSVADFSSTQGQNGWFYGYYAAPDFDTSDFLELGLYEYVAVLDQSIWRFGDQAWTWIGATAQHPHGVNSSGTGKLAIDHHAVRRWVNPVTQGLFIQGTIRAQDNSANGVTARILVETTEVWEQYVPPNQMTSIPFSLSVSVVGGGSVNFTVEPFESNDLGDATEFMYQLCQ